LATETPAETAAAPAPAVEESSEPTPEQTTLIADLHWLIHQGHVIEFANGIMETAKKPLPKPPKAPKPEVKAAETAEKKVEGTAAPESASVEASPETSAAESPSAETAAVPDLSSEQPTSQLAPEAVVEPTSEVPPETPASGESPA